MGLPLLVMVETEQFLPPYRLKEAPTAIDKSQAWPLLGLYQQLAGGIEAVDAMRRDALFQSLRFARLALHRRRQASGPQAVFHTGLVMRETAHGFTSQQLVSAG
ncbi:MAG: hypothetical protein QNJ04_06040 [Desulfobacterales bacterium]|nr:hypothetical protein [Desulfobacterales bacterium]